MFHRWAALVLVLALCAMSPKNAAGQTSKSPRGHSAGKLGANYPNPFNPDTFLPFTVGDSTCAPGSEEHVVTMQLVNVLGQHVVDPVLYGPSTTSTTNFPAALKGRPLRNLKLPCGSYIGYWDGLLPSGREAPSGVYGQMWSIDGFSQETRKIFHRK
jgi:hypothetical protein